MAKAAVDLSYKAKPDCSDLAHIPGRTGLPYFGRSIEALLGWEEMTKKELETYGNVSRIKMLQQHGIMLQGAENLQRVFLDREQAFSAEKGYEQSIGQFYRGGLLMRDFDDHKFQRRIMQTAFKTAAMKTYVDQMTPIMAKHIDGWGSQIEFFPVIKAALLEVGAKVFIGIENNPKLLAKVNKAFLDINDGLLGQVKKEWPGTKYGAGKKGERYLNSYFRNEIPNRRASEGLGDMFTHMAKETMEDGSYFSDDDIIGHAAFLLFAAHDTTTSVLNHMVMFTAMHPEWQEKMRAECQALGKDVLDYEDLDKLDVVDRVFQESLRLRPSVPLMTRRTIKDIEIEGHHIPAHTMVFMPNVSHHRNPEHWPDPQKFDPDRFLPERAEHKNHSFCYTPFGGGAHKCIGMHFAAMLSKTFMFEMLKKYDYRLPKGFAPKAEWFPLPKPKKLPILLSPLK